MEKIRLLQRLVINPCDGNTYLKLGRVLSQQCQQQDLSPARAREAALWAIICYLLAAHFKKDSTTWGVVGINLVKLLEKVGLPQSIAEDCFNHSLDLNPYNHNSLWGRGLVREKLGKYWEALEDFQKAYNVKPDPRTLSHIAKCYLYLGVKDKARKALEEATTLLESLPEPQRESTSRYIIRLAGQGGWQDVVQKVKDEPMEPSIPPDLKMEIEQLKQRRFKEELCRQLEGLARREPDKVKNFLERVKRFQQWVDRSEIDNDQFQSLVNSELKKLDLEVET